MHYEVVANGVLWFLHHGMFDRIRRPRFDLRFRDAWDAFVAVNQSLHRRCRGTAPRNARSCSCRTTSSTLVPGQLRAQRPDLRVVHFTHTPFAGPDDFSLLPTDIGADICRSLASGPAGFHTKRWARGVPAIGSSRARPPGRDSAAVRGQPRARCRGAGRGRRRRPTTRTAAAALADAVGDRLVIARTDRIEPSKNIVRGFLAYDRLLEARPGLRGRVVFVAMVYPSRQGLAEYLAYENEVEQVVARVNDRWATRDWLPILLDDRDDFARSIAGMQRYDVLLVNALRDGLNLVAKEGPVVNRRDGVLCLSPETGAYEELQVGGARGAPVRHRTERGRARRRAVDAARRTGEPRRRSCAPSRRCGHPPTGSPISSATRVSSASRPAGPSTTRSTADFSSGGASADTTPIRTAFSKRPSARARPSSAKAGRSP